MGKTGLKKYALLGVFVLLLTPYATAKAADKEKEPVKFIPLTADEKEHIDYSYSYCSNKVFGTEKFHDWNYQTMGKLGNCLYKYGVQINIQDYYFEGADKLIEKNDAIISTANPELLIITDKGREMVLQMKDEDNAVPKKNGDASATETAPQNKGAPGRYYIYRKKDSGEKKKTPSRIYNKY